MSALPGAPYQGFAAGLRSDYEGRVTNLLRSVLFGMNDNMGRARHLVEVLNEPFYAQPFDPCATEQSHESIQLGAWLTLLHHVGDRYYMDIPVHILDGLLRNERWRTCLETDDGTYAFIELVAKTLALAQRRSSPLGSGAHMRSLVNGLQGCLNTWLGPCRSEHYDLKSFISELFGDVWCARMLKNGVPVPPLLSVINEKRPALMRSMWVLSALPVQESAVAQELPNLGI